MISVPRVKDVLGASRTYVLDYASITCVVSGRMSQLDRGSEWIGADLVLTLDLFPM